MIEAAKRRLTEMRQADAWIARELEAIPSMSKLRVGQGGPTQTRSRNITSPRPADSDSAPRRSQRATDALGRLGTRG